MPQPSLLLEGKKFLRVKEDGRHVVDVRTQGRKIDSWQLTFDQLIMDVSAWKRT